MWRILLWLLCCLPVLLITSRADAIHPGRTNCVSCPRCQNCCELNVAEATGIAALRRTTRDEPDYDVLMRYRLDILAKEGLRLNDIQGVIGRMGPLAGAAEFLAWLRREG